MTLPTLSTDIVDRDRGYRQFSREELFNIDTRTGWLPNNGDLIKDSVRRMFFEVRAVDYTSYTWTEVPWAQTPVINDNPALGGLNPYHNVTTNVYVDTTKNPATMRIDGRFPFIGSDLDSVRIFLGTDITQNGNIISGYMVNGRLSDNKIPLRSITVPGSETVRKEMRTGICTREVENGAGIRVVVYADNGEVAYIAGGQIIKTNYVAASEAPQRQVLDVKLRSPFMDDTNSTTLQLPINIAIDDIPLSVEIHYTDGKRTLAVDGSRVKVVGLHNAGAFDRYYIASNAGHKLPISVSYRLAEDETYIGDDVHFGVITKDYFATTETVDGAYSLKLYVVPVWLDAARGYRLQYVLYNLLRGNFFDVTGHVTSPASSAPFDPLLFNVQQTLNVHVDVSNASPIYKPHVHAQSFAITLRSKGNMEGTNFTLGYQPSGIIYGEEVYAKFVFVNVSFSTLDISCGLTSKSDWLEKLYLPSYPLYDRRNEAGAPEPTHFELVSGGFTYIHPIDAWLAPLAVDYRLVTGSTITIRWLRRTPTDTLYLGQSSMLAHHTLP